MSPKYTVYGDEALDRRIESDMALVAEAALRAVPPAHVAAVVLGGGYGRGEGGVFLEDGGQKLFNDYDMFLITKGLSRRGRRAADARLKEVSEALRGKVEIDVDFGPAKDLGALPRMPFTMMWYDLKRGHQVVWGDGSALASLPDHRAERMPAEEAAKLMLNRGSGLLQAKELLARGGLSEEEREFALRNSMKAALGAGDSLLVLAGRYACSYRERAARMAELKDDPLVASDDFLGLYLEAVDYKLRPSRPGPEAELAGVLERATAAHERFYWRVFGAFAREELPGVEAFREARYFRSPCPGPLAAAPKNLALNLITQGCSRFSAKWFFKYPRDRLYFTLPDLLYGGGGGDEAAAALGLPSTCTRKARLEAFMQLWRRFN